MRQVPCSTHRRPYNPYMVQNDSWTTQVSAARVHLCTFFFPPINTVNVFPLPYDFLKKLNVLRWQWLITLCKCQAHSFITHLCTLLCARHLKPGFLPSPWIWPLPSLSSPFPSGNRHSLVCIYEDFLKNYLSVALLYPKWWYHTVLVLFCLTYLAEYSRDLSTWSQIALFYLFYGCAVFHGMYARPPRYPIIHHRIPGLSPRCG